jgi:GT2 family glycosyltransferase
LRIIVAIATVGRADLTRQTVDALADQTRPPDGIIVVGAGTDDIRDVECARGDPKVLISRRGSCSQRNEALDIARGDAEIVVFLDDDFVPALDFLENVENIFEESPDIVGVTGELIADGIHSTGYTVEEAQELIDKRSSDVDPVFLPRQALYGCNMAIRLSAAEGLMFDETLPLYGWLEDIDFTYQLGSRGRLISTALVTGVHLGTKGGRTSGKRAGYSQVANVIYLWRKGTMQPGLGEQLMRQNLLSNLVRSIRPEPHIDRRGRLWGNLVALKDLAFGRIDPRRIETM